MTEDQWFAGRSAIVTGAANGIGRGIAELLEHLGAQVIAVDKDESALDEHFRAGRYVRRHADVTQDAETLAEDIWLEHGPVQLLVNNVGIETQDRFLDLDERDFDLVFATNLRGPWFFTKRIARYLVDARMSGAILFVSSLHDTFIHTRPHYSASKAAVAMLVKELAHELAPHGIRVNAVSPGNIRTAANATPSPRHVPLGRVGEPVDVARVAAVLLSDEWSGYVTGENVRVDGGLALYSWSAHGHASDTPSRINEKLRRGAGGLRRRIGGRRRGSGAG